ncbi:MAG: FtsH protease activity modulator HflK [Deltaproteobacteria bacterium]|nr:MAG: FtsH protease activity modulator HflK [Deltaproteobacteria bacterium]RLB80340.1 MAG: FtsH protease activity modulator HflK [Deltaproteobacteria bacterium]RLB90854.1 MAG: FtsH protease activity modulator HflK [Deltaproteobacteria bacterium]HDG98920.1 FtsH protease activity modulator HflK [Desulfobacterales bacterium]
MLMTRDNNPGGEQGGPSDLPQIIQKVGDSLSFGKGGKHLRRIVIVLVVVIIFGYTAFYTIPPGNKGVILRFGKFSGIVLPGLHFKIPFGVDSVFKVHTEQVDTASFGFKSVRPGIRTQYKKGATEELESLMLTGDLNVIDVEWIIQFRREDPRKYLFNVRDPVMTLRDISESVNRRIVGNRSFDYVLQNREEVNRMAREELQKILDGYETGIRVVNVRLQNVVPPDPVKGAFNEVNEAQQEKERLINEAQETYNREIPKAKGTAERTINRARGFALERVNRAKGDAARFSAVLKEYRDAKQVTNQRLYLEAYETILANAKQIYIIDSEQKGLLPLLQLNQQVTKGGKGR